MILSTLRAVVFDFTFLISYLVLHSSTRPAIGGHTVSVLAFRPFLFRTIFYPLINNLNIYSFLGTMGTHNSTPFRLGCAIGGNIPGIRIHILLRTVPYTELVILRFIPSGTTGFRTKDTGVG